MQDDFYEYIYHDILGAHPSIRSRKMFGGYGFYKDDIFFAIIANDELYFNVDESNKQDYLDHNCRQFTYQKKDKEFSMSYWSVPEEIMLDSEKLFEWIEKSVAIKKPLKK